MSTESTAELKQILSESVFLIYNLAYFTYLTLLDATTDADLRKQEAALVKLGEIYRDQQLVDYYLLLTSRCS